MFHDKYDMIVRKDISHFPNNQETCLIVGNGTSVLDAELGDKVDSFDTVVRFNAYRIAGYEKHVGTKTDIWATCTADPRNLKEINSYREVIAHSWIIPPEICNTYNKLKKEREDVWKIEPAVWRGIKADFGIQDPSTGLLIIYTMLQRYDVVHLYGFDWWDREKHHYSDKAPRGTIHKPDQELLYIKSWGNRIKFLA